MGEDKHWAQGYLIDPLTAPDPSEETGPGTHFRSTFAPPSSFTPPPPSTTSTDKSPSVTLQEQPTGSSTTSTNPFRRSGGAALPTPPTSASPRKEKFPASHREEAFRSHNGESSGRRRRSSSLTARYPGDESHRPLDIIRRDSKKAHRSPHLSKRHLPGADLIDRLDIHTYHHEGPYDAVLAARNTSKKYSPVAAVADSNAEALKATPIENIENSLRRHRPLEGTAAVPPGVPDKFGRVYDYEEGTDMMRDLGGNYKRWDGITYLPGDLKGKGEPSYTIEKALKDHKISEDGIEMQSRSRNKSLGHADREGIALMNRDFDGDGVRRSNTTGRKVSGGLKRTLGSLRKKIHE